MLEDFSAPTPARGMPHPLPEGIQGVYRLIAVAHIERHKALIALCGLCGCRIGEALSIKPCDFDLTEMLLTIRGKGDKTRIVPISTAAWESLEIPMARAFTSGGG